MAKCDSCGREMLSSATCSVERLMLIDGSYERRRFQSARLPSCGDCGTPNGGMHHPGCDMETCPRCGGQLIACGCWEDLEERGSTTL